MVMPDHKYNSIDKSKTHEPERTSLRYSAAVDVISNAESTRTLSSSFSSFGPKGEIPTLGPKVKTAFPTFGPKVITFPTLGPRTQKLPRRKQSIYKWHRDRTSGIDIGVEIEDDDGKHPIHLNTNSRVLDHFEQLRNDERSFLNLTFRTSQSRYLAKFPG